MRDLEHIWVIAADVRYRCVRCRVIQGVDPLRKTPPCGLLQAQFIRDMYAQPRTTCSSCLRGRDRGHTEDLKCLYDAGSLRIRYCTWCTTPHRAYYERGYGPDCKCHSPSAEYP